MEKQTSKRTWTAWLVKNGMGPDKHGNLDEDYGNCYSEDSQTRNSDWFNEAFEKWQQEGDDING